MCCCGGWWAVIRALFLVADMGSDCLNVWDYHTKAYKKNNGNSNFLSPKFYEHKNATVDKHESVLESYYFTFSFSAMLLPMVIAVICLLFYLLYVYFMEIRQYFISRCCTAECWKVFGTIASSLMAPFTLILCVILSIVVILLSWIVSPLLQILFAFFIAFGSNPAGNNESKLKSLTWKKFATLMMFLSIVETMFEAVPQAILGICLSIHQLKHSSVTDNESRLMHLCKTYPFQVVSLFFSFCSVVKTLGTVAYTTTYDWDNSIFGMVKVLKNQYKAIQRRKSIKAKSKKDFMREKEEEIKMLNDQIKQLNEDKQILTHQKAKAKTDLNREKEEEIEMLNDQIKHLNEDKQNTIDFNNRFNANLKISGFETGNEMERGRFLKDNGIPSELLFDKGSFTDKSCVLTDLNLPESLNFMNTLHGKKYNDNALDINCSIYIVESKIPSTPNSPSIIPLPISEEFEDDENTQLLNVELQKSVNKKEPKKKRSSLLCWRSSSTASLLDDSDLEIQNTNNENDVENTLLNGDLKKQNRFSLLKAKTTSQLDHSEIKIDEEVLNKEALSNEETSDTHSPSCPSTPTLLPENESQSSDTESTQEIKKEENTGDNN